MDHFSLLLWSLLPGSRDLSKHAANDILFSPRSTHRSFRRQPLSATLRPTLWPRLQVLHLHPIADPSRTAWHATETPF